MELPSPTPLQWRKSSRSDINGCVEVANSGPAVLVRDSKDGDGPVLTFSASAWRSFVLRVKRGNAFSRGGDAARLVEP